MGRKAIIAGLSLSLGLAAFAAAPPAGAASVNTIVSRMSLDEKVGQLLQPDFRKWKQAGETAETGFTVMNAEVGSIIRKYKLGGVILFSENVTDTEQTVRLTNGLQSYASGAPLFITIDQEGGTVTRLQTGTNMPGNMALGATRSTTYSKQAYSIIGSELNSVGVNVDFAPSVDVNNNPANPVIGLRSFSSSPALVSKMGQAAVKGMQSKNVAATAKHFPGHGNTADDSHYDCPVVSANKAQWQAVEAVPFQGAIKAGTDFIMSAHVQYPNVDPTMLTSNKIPGKTLVAPATLSRVFLTDILRSQLKFKGVVVTDAMDMGCISSNFTREYAAVKTLVSGADIALMPVTMRSMADEGQLASVIAAIKAAIASGEMPMSEVDAKVKRIIAVKQKLDLYKSRGSVESQVAKALATVGKPSSRRAETNIANKAITVLRNDNATLPMRPVSGQRVVVMAPTTGQTEAMTKEIAALVAQGRIPEVTTTVLAMEKKTFGPADAAVIDAADMVIAGTHITQTDSAVDGGTVEGVGPTDWAIEFPRQAMLRAQSMGKPVVVMGLRTPYDLARFPEAHALVAVYGTRGWENGYLRQPNIPAAIRAAFGVFSPSGKLPVEIPSASQPNMIMFPFGTGLTYPAVGGSGSGSD